MARVRLTPAPETKAPRRGAQACHLFETLLELIQPAHRRRVPAFAESIRHAAIKQRPPDVTAIIYPSAASSR